MKGQKKFTGLTQIRQMQQKKKRIPSLHTSYGKLTRKLVINITKRH